MEPTKSTTIPDNILVAISFSASFVYTNCSFIYTLISLSLSTPCSYDVMYQCWNEKPLNRSTFTQHRLTFESFLSSPTPPNRLVTMEIDEQKPYYHYINRHEPLHRLSAQPSPGGNRPIAMVTVPNNPSNQYADRVLPRIVEEKEGSDVEAGGGSGWSSPAHGYSEETGSTDDGGSHGSHEPMITSTI